MALRLMVKEQPQLLLKKILVLSIVAVEAEALAMVLLMVGMLPKVLEELMVVVEALPKVLLQSVVLLIAVAVAVVHLMGMPRALVGLVLLLFVINVNKMGCKK